jgi:hypothetical protein
MVFTDSRRKLATTVAVASIALLPACGGDDGAEESQSAEEVEELNQEAQEVQEELEGQQLDLGPPGGGNSKPPLPGDPAAVDKQLEQQRQRLEDLSEGTSP